MKGENMLGLLVFAYGVAGYVMFWQAVSRLDPRSRLPTWIKLIGALTALLFGPTIFTYVLARALTNPRYWPTEVVFVEIEYDPTTGTLSQQREYAMTWRSRADLDGLRRVLIH